MNADGKPEEKATNNNRFNNSGSGMNRSDHNRFNHNRFNNNRFNNNKFNRKTSSLKRWVCAAVLSVIATVSVSEGVYGGAAAGRRLPQPSGMSQPQRPETPLTAAMPSVPVIRTLHTAAVTAPDEMSGVTTAPDQLSDMTAASMPYMPEEDRDLPVPYTPSGDTDLSVPYIPSEGTGPLATYTPSEGTDTSAPDQSSGGMDPAVPYTPSEDMETTIPDQSSDTTVPSIPDQPSEGTDTSAPGQPADTTVPSMPDPSVVSPPEPQLPLVVRVQQPEQKKRAVISWKQAKRAVSYRIYRSDKKDGVYKKIAVRNAGSGQYTDKSVERGKYYYYRVTAVLENGGKRQSRRLAFACQVKSVKEVKLIRYSTSSIKVTWKKSGQAAFYKVYYAKQKKGNYKLAGITQDTWYRVERLQNNQTYYFQVKSCVAKKDSDLDSVPAPPVSITTRTYERTTVFAGDSITTGLSGYGTVDAMDIGGYKEVIAAIGLNTTTFRTRREFGGLSALGRLIADHPYRAYIMLGTNEIEYRGCGDIIDGYREIVRSIQAETPETDIVLLAVPPVTSHTRQTHKGFAQIPALNGQLKEMAAALGVKYFDYTQVLKDTNGCLQSQYAENDGIHWKIAAYRLFAGQIETYDRSLD